MCKLIKFLDRYRWWINNRYTPEIFKLIDSLGFMGLIIGAIFIPLIGNEISLLLTSAVGFLCKASMYYTFYRREY